MLYTVNKIKHLSEVQLNKDDLRNKWAQFCSAMLGGYKNGEFHNCKVYV